MFFVWLKERLGLGFSGTLDWFIPVWSSGFSYKKNRFQYLEEYILFLSDFLGEIIKMWSILMNAIHKIWTLATAVINQV